MVKSNCVICNAKSSYSFNLGSIPISNQYANSKKVEKYLLKIDYCNQCKLLFNSNPPEAKKMFHSKYPYNISLSSSFKKYSYLAAKELNDNFLKDKKNPFVIEIGSSDGSHLEFYKNKKINHLGIEPTKNNHKIAVSNHINSLNIFFNSNNAEVISQKIGKADLIVSFNVIAHINNVDKTFKNIKKILKKNSGVFIFENIYLDNLLKTLSFDQLYDEHIYTFSVTSINSLCKKHNLNLFDVKKTNIQGGSMRYYITNNLNKKKLARVKLLLNKEKKIDNDLIKNFFKESIIKINQIFHILKNLVNKNHVIAGYGASAKSVLVLNMLNIDRKVIKFFFDNSKNKINNCLPGTDIKIFSEKNINQFKFDYIILFAWNHFDEIYNKNKNKISKNIKWIIPNLKNKFIKIINNK